jgi:putative oxidoreductase
MNTVDTLASRATPHLLGVLRIITGFLFAAHGMQKLFNYPASPNGPAELFSFMGFAGVLELVGGLLIMVGLFTRITAFILSGMMAVAYFMAHAPGGFLPLVNKGELAVLYSFVFLFLAAAGGGSFSLDGLFGRSRTASIGAAPETV